MTQINVKIGCQVNYAFVSVIYNWIIETISKEIIMKNVNTPVELNAKIYNDLVKVFNDASNGLDEEGRKHYNLEICRDQIIKARKQFPTYQELKDSGIKFVNKPVFKYEDGTVGECKTWIGSENNPSGNADILEADIVYSIAFIVAADPVNFQPTVVLKVRGIPKPELADK